MPEAPFGRQLVLAEQLRVMQQQVRLRGELQRGWMIFAVAVRTRAERYRAVIGDVGELVLSSLIL